MNLPKNLLDLSSSIDESESKDIFIRHIQPHAQMLYNSALKLCRNPDDAQDLVQETFFFAIKNFSQLRDLEKCRFWLFSILRNLFLKEIQKQKKRSDLQFELLLKNIRGKNYLDSELVKMETRGILRDLLASMDQRLKEPIELFYFQSRSYKEISKSLNVPMGTVMSRIARGKVYLKKAILRSKNFREEAESWESDED